MKRKKIKGKKRHLKKIDEEARDEEENAQRNYYSCR